MSRTFAAWQFLLFASLAASASAQGFTPLAMPNKQSTHLPAVTLNRSPSVTFNDLPTHPWQARPLTMPSQVSFGYLPQPHLQQPAYIPSPNVSFKHSALSARPVGTRTTIAATQVELATRFPVLPFAQPMVPALMPDANVTPRRQSSPLTDGPSLLPRPSQDIDSDPATSLAVPARRTSPAPRHDQPVDAAPTSASPARAGRADYGDLLWQAR